MINLNAIGKDIVKNRIKKGWPSAHDLSKTTCGLAEEVGEFEKARKRNNEEKMVKELIDVMAFCLGGLEMLKVDIEKELEIVIKALPTRTHKGVH